MNTTPATPDFSKYHKHGFTGISVERHDQIIADITAEGFRIIAEEWSVSTLTLHRGNQTLPARKVYESEGRLMNKWGNPPHCLATDFTSYRLTFYAND